MDGRKVERILRRYVSRRTTNAKQKFPDRGIKYVLRLEKIPFRNKNAGQSSWIWTGNVLISYSRGGGISVPLFQERHFRKRIDAMKHLLKGFSGGKSPEEIVLEMESRGEFS